MFTLTGNKKESSKLIRIIISKDWGEKLKAATLKMWNENKDKINYFKKITFNGKVTETSGQYLPKHIMAIKEFATAGQDTISFNQKRLKEFLTSSVFPSNLTLASLTICPNCGRSSGERFFMPFMMFL